MKTESLFTPSKPETQEIDKKVKSYLEAKGLDDFHGNMSIAILETNDIKNFSPFRTIYTDGLGEFMSTCMELEKLGLTCINKNDIDSLKGFDSVFVPDIELV
ncbi:hypothetical protein AB4407_07670 [Vibrio sp. 10N.261.46.E11]|uniref:hypothetical protein n=1 Tax=Vibrio sp. 10N.261.46.E11 TaxID=3229662 RepID=UPI00354ECBEE